MESKLSAFCKEDKIWLLSLKKRMSVDQSVVNDLWEIHLKLFGKYPNYSKSDPCGRCIVDVLNDCIQIASNIQFEDQIKVEEKPKLKKGKKNEQNS